MGQKRDRSKFWGVCMLCLCYCVCYCSPALALCIRGHCLKVPSVAGLTARGYGLQMQDLLSIYLNVMLMSTHGNYVITLIAFRLQEKYFSQYWSQYHVSICGVFPTIPRVMDLVRVAEVRYCFSIYFSWPTSVHPTLSRRRLRSCEVGLLRESRSEVRQQPADMDKRQNNYD